MRKGQTLSIEETLFLGMGLILIVGTFAIFQSVSDIASSDIEGNTAAGVLEHIAANIEGLRKSGAGHVEIEMIPRINREEYIIAGRGTKSMSLTKLSGELVATKTTTVPVFGQVQSSSNMRLEYNRTGFVRIRGVWY